MSNQFSERDRKFGCDGIMAEELRAVSSESGDGHETLSNRSKDAQTLKVGTEDALALTPESIKPGSLLGSYQLMHKLGDGGMGSVYLARHLYLDRLVAIKILPPDPPINTTDQHNPASSALERFLLESQAIASLNHKNIVRAHDFAEQGRIHYLAMEYVEGIDLDRMVRQRGPLNEEIVAEYIRQAALGLAHIHASGMVHRDIKPANLLVDGHGVVKLLDLGVVRMINSIDPSLTLKFKEQLLGTIDFLAPEQGLDSHKVDSRSDLYSLGCTLYFLLAGRPPFPEGTLAQRMLKHQLHEPIHIRKLRPDISSDLAVLCMKLLGKRPSERIQTAEEVASMLQTWLEARVENLEVLSAEYAYDGQHTADHELLEGDVEAGDNTTIIVSNDGPGNMFGCLVSELDDDFHTPGDDTQELYLQENTRDMDWRAPLVAAPLPEEVEAPAPRRERVCRQPKDLKLVNRRRLVAAIVTLAILVGGVELALTVTSASPKTSVQASTVSTLLHSNGRIESQGNMVDGKQTGLWTYWGPSGDKIASGQFISGLKEGEWTYWVNNGQLQSQGIYKAGQRHGKWTFRYPDGQNMKNGRFVDGQPDGFWTFWHPNGIRQAEGAFATGNPVGEWNAWDVQGNPISTLNALEIAKSVSF